jgi:hypothetical protein
MRGERSEQTSTTALPQTSHPSNQLIGPLPTRDTAPSLHDVHMRAYSGLRWEVQSCAVPLQIGPFCCEHASL